MPNRERTPCEQFREWKEALAPYEKDIEEFAKENSLEVNKWYHDSPFWFIGKTQKIDDLDKVWWSIQIGYNEKEKRLGLTASAWIDREYDVPDGRSS